MMWHSPSVWALVLLLFTPIVCWRYVVRRSSIRFSAVGSMANIPSSWTVRLRWIVPTLRVLVFIGLVVCLARPQKVNEQTRRFSEGIAIQLVVDRSYSMIIDDFVIEGQRASRFEAVQDVVERFITGDEELDGRPNDLIGFIGFASFADSLTPLTLDHDHVVHTVRETQIETLGNESGTAIGDALALAVERLRSVDDRADVFGGQNIKSRIIVLLTDGENNAGILDPMMAAELAVTFDMRVYTIGAGRDRGTVMTRGGPINSSIDEATLRAIAARTGGAYFRAENTSSLRDVYRQIDSLEKTKIEQQRLVDTREMAVTPVRLGGLPIPPLVTVVIALLTIQILLETTRFGRLPA
ncbi:MAG: VWA domain-containing protein [Planctomycetota bacterium]